MIKIERMTKDCVAKIDGVQEVFVGQLINQKQLNRLMVESGELMYTINEQEIRYRNNKGDFSKPVQEEENKTLNTEELVETVDHQKQLETAAQMLEKKRQLEEQKEKPLGHVPPKATPKPAKSN